jgi:integrase
MELDVFERSDSPYWFAYLNDGGKRKKVSLKLVAKGPGAVRRAVAIKAAQGLQEKLDHAPQTETLLQALNDHCAAMEAAGKPYYRHATTLRDKLLGLRPVVRLKKGAVAAVFHLEPNMLVSELTKQHIVRLVEARRKEGSSPQTIKHEIGLLRAAVIRATARGGAVPRITIENDWAIPVVGQKTRYLEMAEWQRVYDALDPDRDVVRVRKATGKVYAKLGGNTKLVYAKLGGNTKRQTQDARDMLVALTMTGGRWSEVASLRWSKLDWSEGVVRLWGGKVGKERLVPLPEQFQEVLHRRRAEAPKDALYVFPGMHGDKMTAPSQAIRKAMDRAGLNSDPETIKAHGKATIHSLRHTFASWLLQNGAELSAVRDMLGHSTVSTTERYAHLEKGKTAKRMGSILSNIGGTTQQLHLVSASCEERLKT